MSRIHSWYGVALCFPLFGAIADVSAWIAPAVKLSEEGQELVDDYVAWHNKVESEQGTKLFILRPVNGLGDQMINFVKDVLHYCVMTTRKGKRLRFEIAPGDGDSLSTFQGRVADAGIWTAGINGRINIIHDPERAKRLKQVIVEERTTPCWARTGCPYLSSDRVITPVQALHALLLHPAPATRSLLTNALPVEKPKHMIGIHLRTWVLSVAEGHRSTPESLAKHNKPIFEFKTARSLYDNVVAALADCAIKAANKITKQNEPNTVAVFVTSDYLEFTKSVQNYLVEKQPHLMVSSMPGKPVWSHRPYDTSANNKDYENVWATWFALAQSDTLCVGNSMFSTSAQTVRLGGHPSVARHGDCPTLAFMALNQFAVLVSKGYSPSLQTLVRAYRNDEGRHTYKDKSCFPKELLDALGGKSEL